MDISTPTPEIAKWHSRWKRNRDFVEGEESVKMREETYLPKARVDDSIAEYQAHLARTGFFPCPRERGSATRSNAGITG